MALWVWLGGWVGAWGVGWVGEWQVCVGGFGCVGGFEWGWVCGCVWECGDACRRELGYQDTFHAAYVATLPPWFKGGLSYTL